MEGAARRPESPRRIRRRAASQLEELEELYRFAPVGLCAVDLDLRFVRVNDAYAELAGYDPDELIGRTMHEVLPESVRDPAAALAAQVIETGEPTGLITVLQDVTALAERRREVEAVRDRLAEAQRVARLGSYEWNILEDEVWWSQELYEIFGERRDYVPSYVGFFERVHPEDRPSVREQLDLTLADGRSYRVTFRIVRRDGSERVLFTSARVERTPDGQVARLVGTCQDVTDAGPLDSGE